MLRGKQLRILSLVGILLLILSAQAFSAEYANPQLLADVKVVADNIGKPDWVVIDCRDKKAYDTGHIPGAISLGDTCDKVLRDATSRVRPVKELEKLLGDAGVSEKHTVVVYSDAKGITNATVAFWILEYLGHPDVRILHGGIEEWQAAGNALETAETKLKPTTYKANVNEKRIATTAEVLKIAKGRKDVQLVDSRTKAEHEGRDIRALRGGHIPNTTINVSHTETFDPKTGKIKSMAELEALFGKLDKNKRTIAYCQTGTRSTLTYLQLRLMGFKDPANYDDSWRIYGSHVDYPVANENWYDFAKVNKAIKEVKELKQKVEELEKLLKK